MKNKQATKKAKLFTTNEIHKETNNERTNQKQKLRTKWKTKKAKPTNERMKDDEKREIVSVYAWITGLFIMQFYTPIISLPPHL